MGLHAIVAFSIIFFRLENKQQNFLNPISISYIEYTAAPKPKNKMIAKVESTASQGIVRQGAEFLFDPKKGRIFCDYFAKVKSTIHKTFERKYAGFFEGRGRVTLNFILRPDGSLDRVFVVGEETDAPRETQDFMISCVRAAAPFTSFPKELGSDKIAFKLNNLF